MKAFVAKYWPSIVTVLAAAASFLSPSVQNFAGAHPQYSSAIVAAWGVLLHHLPSPNAAK